MDFSQLMNTVNGYVPMKSLALILFILSVVLQQYCYSYG